MKKIYTLEYIGEGPGGDKYFDLYGPSNGWIGQYPSKEQAKMAALSCAKNKKYLLKNTIIAMKGENYYESLESNKHENF